jgi:L-iditol 2-dehydrogenase
MKAAILKEIGEIEIEDVEKPEAGLDELLIKVEYVGICGSDVHYYEHGRIGDFVAEKPLILGHECSGIVVEAGEGVEGFEPGDRVVPEPGYACNKCVFCKQGKYNLCDKMTFMGTPPVDGAFCEYISYPADMVFKLPDNMSLEEAALIEPLSIGIYATQRAGVSPGDTVLITGAGCIGLVTMMACRAYGASRIIVTDVIDNRLEAAKRLGADFAVNPSKTNLHDLVANVTGDMGVDVSIDCVGIDSTLADAVDNTMKGGVVIVVGMGSDSTVSINMNRAINKELDFRTIFRYKNIFPKAVKLVSEGLIDIKGIASHYFDFKDIAKAMEFVKNHKDEVVKAVVKMQ